MPIWRFMVRQAHHERGKGTLERPWPASQGLSVFKILIPSFPRRNVTPYLIRGGNPGDLCSRGHWIPAFAGMTKKGEPKNPGQRQNRHAGESRYPENSCYADDCRCVDCPGSCFRRNDVFPARDPTDSEQLPAGNEFRPLTTQGAEVSVGIRLERPDPPGSGWAFPALDLAFLGLVAQGATLVRRGIFHQAVDLASFVVFGEMFGDRQTCLIHEQQSMAVFVDLHVVAGADPRAMLDLLFL